MLPLVKEWLGEYTELSFQYDNASVHDNRYTNAWLQANGIQYIWWPAKSPDLNPIENVWSWMKDHIYRVIGGYERLSGNRFRDAVVEA